MAHVIDWSKPVEYDYSDNCWIPLVVLFQNSECALTQYTVDGNNYFATWRKKSEPFMYIRNVPPPKKKMWEVTLRKVSTLKKTYEFHPLVRHGGKLCGFTGWTVEEVKEIEV